MTLSNNTLLFRWLDDLRRDAAYAVRSLSRNPGFTAAAVLTLAVGIGATTAIYSVVDTILLQPLPFADAFAVSMGETVVRTSDGTARLWGGSTSANTFTMLGTRAMLGRTLDSGDD